MTAQPEHPLHDGTTLPAEPAPEEIARAHGVGTGQVVLRRHSSRGSSRSPPARTRGDAASTGS